MPPLQKHYLGEGKKFVSSHPTQYCVIARSMSCSMGRFMRRGNLTLCVVLKRFYSGASSFIQDLIIEIPGQARNDKRGEIASRETLVMAWFTEDLRRINILKEVLAAAHLIERLRMRAVIQRVKRARLHVEGVYGGEIQAGLVVFVGVGRFDSVEDAGRLAKKIVGLRIFENDLGKMDQSVADIGGGIMMISQFTLYGNCKRGNRPDFGCAAPPEKALPLYEAAVCQVRSLCSQQKVVCGVFGKKMLIDISNDGPVTVLMDTVDYTS